MVSDPQQKSVLLEVLAHVPTDFFHCSHCEQLFSMADIGAAARLEMRHTYPPEMLEEAVHLAVWLQNLSARYGERVHIRVVAPQSPEGFFKSLRYRVRRYPTFIINRRARHTGWEPAVLEGLLAEESAGSKDVNMSVWEAIREKLRHAIRAAREFIYGATTFDWVREMQRERGEIERLFALVTFGDLVGLPILPPYYTLRLLPYVVPAINRWRRCILRERDWCDLAGTIEM